MTAEVKFFQLRDEGANIPVMCVRIAVEDATDPIIGLGKVTNNMRDKAIARRAGWGSTPGVFMIDLNSGAVAHYDAYAHKDRTRHGCHVYIEKNWATLNSGDVVDARVAYEEACAPAEFEW